MLISAHNEDNLCTTLFFLFRNTAVMRKSLTTVFPSISVLLNSSQVSRPSSVISCISECIFRIGAIRSGHLQLRRLPLILVPFVNCTCSLLSSVAGRSGQKRTPSKAKSSPKKKKRRILKSVSTTFREKQAENHLAASNPTFSGFVRFRQR